MKKTIKEKALLACEKQYKGWCSKYNKYGHKTTG